MSPDLTSVLDNNNSGSLREINSAVSVEASIKSNQAIGMFAEGERNTSLLAINPKFDEESV